MPGESQAAAAPPPPAQPRPFTGFVQDLRRGVLHQELSEAMAELVTAVLDQKKNGTLTLKITVSAGRTDGTVDVVAEHAVKAPKPKPAATLFFEDGKGNLTRTNPFQGELPLQQVPAPQVQEASAR